MINLTRCKVYIFVSRYPIFIADEPKIFLKVRNSFQGSFSFLGVFRSHHKGTSVLKCHRSGDHFSYFLIECKKARFVCSFFHKFKFSSSYIKISLCKDSHLTIFLMVIFDVQFYLDHTKRFPQIKWDFCFESGMKWGILYSSGMKW